MTAPRVRQLIEGYRDAKGVVVAGLDGGFVYQQLVMDLD